MDFSKDALEKRMHQISRPRYWPQEDWIEITAIAFIFGVQIDVFVYSDSPTYSYGWPARGTIRMAMIHGCHYISLLNGEEASDYF